MHRTGRSFGIIVLCFCLTAIVSAQKQWIGTYEFNEDGGTTAGGTSIQVYHTIEVTEADEGLIVFIKSQGYQTSRDIVGKASVAGNKLIIRFESYGEDNVFENFEREDLLLTLEQKNEKGKNILLTHWGKFEPVIPKNERSGKTYFVKVQ